MEQPQPGSKAFRKFNSRRTTSSLELAPIKDHNNSHQPSSRANSCKQSKTSTLKPEQPQAIKLQPPSSRHNSRWLSSSNRMDRPTYWTPRNSSSLNSRTSSNSKINCCEPSTAGPKPRPKLANSIKSSLEIYLLKTRPMEASTSSSLL